MIINRFILSIFLTTTCGLVYAKGSIPKQFRGAWNISSNCGDGGDTYTKITANSVNRHEQSCDLKKIIKSNKTEFSGIFTCTGEGENWDIQHDMKLNRGKLILDESVMIKCK